ncbi:MAG: tyrosine-type recombinase/integrase [Proteobacteria bacterium]|nr:tyrosine-type recombinase/integrase [Pseudomonadota bacterium]
MPLRIVRRPGRATLYVRGTVRGQSVFESTGTERPDAAEAFRVKREGELWNTAVFGARSTATFQAAAESYLIAEPRTAGTKALVHRLLLTLGPLPLARVDQEQVDRLFRQMLRPNASPATKLRNVLTPLRAILEHAARRGLCDRPAFEVPRQPRPRVAFLTPDQATALIDAAAAHLRPLLVFLIGTGARMSEALELDWRDVDLAAARVTFRRTKSGVERWADLPPAARAALAALPEREGRVFRPVHAVRRQKGQSGQQWRTGAAYRDTDRTGGGQIRTAWAAAWRRAGLPGTWHTWTSRKGVACKRFKPAQHPHDLRHTAATWHYAVHRDLLRLQAFGGWADVSEVQVYAHLLPEAYAADAAAWLGLSSTPSAARIA